MEFPRTLFFISFFLFHLLHLSSSLFSPADNYLLSCGGNTNTSFYNRVFTADSTKPGSSFLSSDRSVSLSDPNPPPDSPILYHAARVFTKESVYKFEITRNGTHFIRLHFSPFSAQNFNLGSAKFRVLVNGFPVLSGFSTKIAVVKEYLLKIDDRELEITFRPDGNLGLGFINAIEVFSAPRDFIIDAGTKLVTSNEIVVYKNVSSHVLETIHRINVGGLKLTPFNDSLWRNWIPDDNFLVLKSAAKRVVSTHTPNYQSGGATQETAPDNVYMTAQEMNRDSSELQSRFNITWNFPVGSPGGGGGGVRHLIRLHFCDIVSPALNQLYFNVYINDYSAYKDLDLSTLTFHVLASPVYIDFVAASDESGKIRVSVGPSDLSSSLKLNALLNGVEIMRIISPVGSKSGSNRKHILILSGSIVGGFLFLSLVLLCVLCMCKRNKGKPRRSDSVGWTPLRRFGCSSHTRTSEGTANASPGRNGYASLKFSFSELQSATNNFDKNLIVGMGGFGMVYKAVLRDNTKVAVKRGVPGSRQGLPEFQTEITILSRIRHRHLVSLVGYCEEQSEMILVYEYMEKGPLKSHLYGSKNPPLSWKQRLEICVGAARGLHYLHTGSAQGIIHRDIKSTNILLDENYIAKVADFGLSRSGPCLDETHVSTGVKGSFGYLDPEYFRRQQLTDKSDVYSFGVVLFEVLCARPAVDPLLAREQVNLAEWAIEWQKKGLLEEVIDSRIARDINPKSLKKYAETAEKCCADYGVDRPSMGDVLWNLEHALQLQESESQQLPRDMGSVSEPLPQGSAMESASSSSHTDQDNGYGGSQVFSQLMTKEGR